MAGGSRAGLKPIVQNERVTRTGRYGAVADSVIPCALLHPVVQLRDLPGGQLITAGVRHLDARVGPSFNKRVDDTRQRITRHDDSAEAGTLHQVRVAVKLETAGFGTRLSLDVAADAVLIKDWCDMTVEADGRRRGAAAAQRKHAHHGYRRRQSSIGKRTGLFMAASLKYKFTLNDDETHPCFYREERAIIKSYLRF